MVAGEDHGIRYLPSQKGDLAPAHRALPNPAKPARVYWDARRREREGGVKHLAGKPSPGRSQLGFSSASGLFRFPISISPMCERGQSCWMKSFVKCVQISC